MCYKQLTQEERHTIYILRKEEYSVSERARATGRQRSTIHRELNRNTGNRGYHYHQAQHHALYRRHNSRKQIKLNESVQKNIVKKLELKWSPEQISGWPKKQKLNAVSHEAIYQFIREDRAYGGQLYKHLRQGRKKRRKKYGTGKSSRRQIKNRISIDERPTQVDEKREPGYWEGDTIVSKAGKESLITLVERTSKLTCIIKAPDRKAATINELISKRMKKFNISSITFDNGKEFSMHESIASELDCDIYFAHPYHSWERGLMLHLMVESAI